MNKPNIYITIDTVRKDGRLDYRGTDVGYLSIHYRADNYWVLKAEAKRFKSRWGSDLDRNTPTTYYLFYMFNRQVGEPPKVREELRGECLMEIAPGKDWHAATARLRAEAGHLAHKARLARGEDGTNVPGLVPIGEGK